MKLNHIPSILSGHIKLLSVVLALGILSPLAAQNNQVTFGKNRVQHHKFTWFEYDSDNFTTYWSGDTRAIAHTTVQMAEWDYAEIQEILEHRINKKIEIIVYADITDVKQSNIGNEEAFVNAGGQTKIVENKIFVFFDGNHNQLREQIREGIAQVYINNMLFGSNLQEVVQNAVLLNLPKWYTQGLAGYVGKKWDTDLDNQLRDVIISNKYKDFEDFAANEPKLAGQSLWYYIDINYGQSTVSNLVYLTRINRSIGSGFLYVLGSPYGRTLINWKEYFDQRYAEGNNHLVLPSDSLRIKLRNKKKLPVANAKVSPDGKYIIYSTNEQGKQKIYLQNMSDGKRSVIFKTGFRNNIQATDYGYPLIAWAPNSQTIGIVYEKRDVIKFAQIDVNSKEKTVEEFAPIYQRVYSIDYLNNNELVISGTTKGVSDIMIYRINQRSTKRITNDFYDDLDPVLVRLNGKTGVLFKSNRGDDLSLEINGLDSIIPTGTFDIYYHEIGGESDELARITNTPYANESSPMAVDSNFYSFLSDVSGIRNRYTGSLEEYIAYHEKVVLLKTGDELLFHPDSIPGIEDGAIDSTFIRPIVKIRGKNYPATNYRRNIIDANISSRSGKLVENIYHNGIHKLYVSDADPSLKAGLYNSTFRQQLLKKKRDEKIEEKEKEEIKIKQKEPKEKPSSWEFESDFGQTEVKEETEEPSLEVETSNEEKKEEEIGFVFITDYPEEEEEEESKTKEAENEEKEVIDIDNYEFENDFNTEVVDAAVIVESDEGRVTLQSPTNASVEQVSLEPEKKVHRFYTPNILSHRLKFKANSITVQLDNSPMFGGYDIYTGNPYEHVPPSLLFKSSVQDLFEDYELEGGLRVPTSFNGLEYFVTFKDKKKRLDKSYSYYRRNTKEGIESPPFGHFSQPNNNSPLIQPILNPSATSPIIIGLPYHIKTTSNLIQAAFSYPLDIYSSFRGSITGRMDKTEFTSNDKVTLESEPYKNQRISARLEYVFDNTLDIDLNIKHGTRLKLYSEVYKKMDVDITNGFKWNFNKGVMGLFGADIRHYQRLGRHAVLAGRVTGATSVGTEKILFYIGGGDSELLPRFNSNIPTPDIATTDFAYQTLATPLRGFHTNIRNGNSFFLGNVELRVPLFKYFYNRPIKSSFLRNFQLVGFFDIGTAWYGKSPFSNDSPLNTTYVSPPPDVPQTITIKVNYYRDPIVAGFGGGVRTKIFGYFLRVDYGLGIETKEIQEGTWHISLGTDF